MMKNFENANKKNLKIKGVLFDMDGTMFDTETMSIFGWAAAARKYNVSISKDFMISCMGLVTEAIEQKFHDKYGSDFDYGALRRDKLKIMEDIIERDGVPHKEGLIELLKFLKENGIKCAVATSTTNSRAMLNLDCGGVTEYFDAIISGDMVEKGKPEPDIYIYAAEKLGLVPQECMVLEDSKNGIISAKASGAVSVLIPDIIPVDDTMKSSADYICKNLLEVKELICELK